MIVKPSNLASGRREFLLNLLPAGSLFCLGCGDLSAWSAGQEVQKAVEMKHKFQEDSGMSFQEVFEFAYKGFARLMKSFGDEIGKDNLVEMMKRVIDNEIKKEALKEAKDFQVNDFASFRAGLRKEPDRFWGHVQTDTIVEDTDKAIESRVTECLFAKTFRDADAADIGYAYFCYGDFAMARAYNPKLRLIRTKTLMNGDDCCNLRWVWEG
jgi:L-2-amino-thiazoline-4-carboxylic acid hydrolase